MTARRTGLGALSVLGVSLCVSLAHGQGEPPAPGREDPADARLRLDVDPHGLSKELARVDQLLARGSVEEAVALLDRLGEDPRARDGFAVLKGGPWRERILASFDRSLRAKLLSLPDAAQRAAADAHEDRARRLLELGRQDDLEALELLLARFPVARQAGTAAVLLGERELELGEGEAAAARLDQALREAERRLSPDERARARRQLPPALALAGRDAEADVALSRLEGEDRRLSRSAVELVRKSRDLASVVGPSTKSRQLVWARETPDWYEEEGDAKTPPRPWSEPLLDGKRVYLHDGSHAIALSIETGKVAWQSALRPGEDSYRRPAGPCRMALGSSVVACVLPLGEGAFVALDRTSGAVLARFTHAELRKLAKLEDESVSIAPTVAVAGSTVVLALVAHHADDELWLVGLDARTGAFRWKVYVVGEPADPQAPDPVLSMGPDAVYVLSCRGVVAQVEPSTGSIAWLRRYASSRDEAPGETAPGPAGRAILRRVRPFAPQPPTDEEAAPARKEPPRHGWVGRVRGLVLAAPPDAPALLAFRPEAGEDAFFTVDDLGEVLAPWKDGVLELRKDGAVVAVGRTVKEVARLEGARLVGRAALEGGALLLPLEGGVVRVDTAGGTSALLTDWKVLGGLPGNLAASGASVLAVGPARLVALSEGETAAAAALSDAHGAVRALGASAWTTRQAAQEKLIELGEGARAELEEATSSADAERRLRARLVLDELARRQRIAAWTPRLKPEWLSAHPTILPLLTHRSAEVRLRAVGGLATLLGAEAATPLLRDLTRDPDLRVASSAAVALLRAGDRSGIAVLERALEEGGPSDRLAAVDVLGSAGTPEDLPLLARAAKDEDPAVRTKAVAGALGKGGERGLEIAAGALDDKDEAVRSGVAREILARDLPIDVLGPLLVKLVQDPQRDVRERTLAACVFRTPDEQEREKRDKRRSSTGVPISHPLVFAACTQALSDADATVRDQAMTILVNTRRSDMKYFPREAIEKALDLPNQSKHDRDYLIQLAEAVLESGTPVAPGPLARLALSAEGPELRRHALSAIFQSVQLAPITSADAAAIGTLTYQGLQPAEAPGSAPPLPRTPGADVDRDKEAEKAAQRAHEDLNARYVAYQSLVGANGPGRASFLLHGLEDPDEQIRTYVRGKLPLVVDPDLYHALLRREAQSESPEQQALAAGVLDSPVEGKTSVLVPVLLGALEDPDPRVREAAWRRVHAFAREEEDLGLFEARGDPLERGEAVRRAARWWWRRTHGGSEPPAAFGGLSAPSGADRWRAAKRLRDLARPEFHSLISPELLDALAIAAAREPEAYVQREELQALGAVVGRSFTWPEGAPESERRRVLETARAWRTAPLTSLPPGTGGAARAVSPPGASLPTR